MMAMNAWKKLLIGSCMLAVCTSVYSQSTDPPQPPTPDKPTKSSKSSVTKLDGTKLFGIIEITDDYTIKISSDSGITRLPIAQLGDADFKKFGMNKDRSQDGRFWYERKEAVKDSEKNSGNSKSGSGGNSPVEIRLGEIAAFQPVIAAYEKTLGAKKSEKSSNSKDAADPADKTTKTDDSSFTPMFSQPGFVEPLTGMGSAVLQPVTGAAGSVQSVTGAAGALPSAP